MKTIEASKTKIDAMIIERRRTLSVLRDVIQSEGHRGECDDCHDETKVIEDPDTADQGRFELCKNCIERRIIRITHRINKD